MSDNLTNGENAEEVNEVEAVEEAVGEVAVEAAAEAAALSETELVTEAAPEAAAEPAAELAAETEAAPEATADSAAAPESAPAAPAAPAPETESRPAETQRTGPTSYVESEGGRPSRIGSGVKVSEVDYKNIAMLSRFLDRRGRILSRRKTRVSAKVQRRVAQAIKRARHLALLPYTSDQTRVVRKRR